MKSALGKLQAILRRDLLTAIRHRTGFAITALGLITQLAAFYFLSRAIGPGFRFLSTVQEAQQTGTMEVLMTTSTPPAQLVVLSSISAFAGNLISLALYLAAGVALFRAPIHANVLSCLAVLSLSLVIAMALGIAVATVQITFQKGSALLWLLSSGVWFLSGAMFPIESLPRPLALVAHAIPLTYSVEGMRMALLQDQSILAMAPTLGALAGFSLGLLPLTLWGLSFSLRRARQNGTLSFY